MTKHTATSSTVQGGRRTRKSKKGGSALTPAPVQSGGADLAPASFKGGSDKKMSGGENEKPKMSGGEHDKPKMSGGEDMVVEKQNDANVGGNKSGAACGKAYCVKCKKNKMAMINCKNVTSKNGRSMLKGNCKKCGTKMNKFI